MRKKKAKNTGFSRALAVIRKAIAVPIAFIALTSVISLVLSVAVGLFFYIAKFVLSTLGV